MRTRALSSTWSNAHSVMLAPDSVTGKVWLLVILYGASTFLLQTDMMLPWGSGFAVAFVWFAAHVGGVVAQGLKLPPLLGYLAAGMLLKNVISEDNWNGRSVRGMPDSWASDIITFGLTIIFLRGGLDINLDTVRKEAAVISRLTIMPGVSEALVVAALSTAIFDMDLTLGLSFGFILAAVSPAVVVGAMFELKKHGYGLAKNIPVLVIAAASFDDVVAISGFSTCVWFAIKPNSSCDSSSAVEIFANASNCTGHSNGSDDTVRSFLSGFHGPIVLVLGLSLGIFCGRIAAMTQLWDLPWKRTAIVLGQGVCLAFGAKMLEDRWKVEAEIHPIGANTGILATLLMAGVASYRWRRGQGFCSTAMALGASMDFQHETEAHLAELWEHVAQPLLFGVVGSYLDVRNMPGETVGKAVAIILCGLAARTCAAVLATSGTQLDLQERFFIAFAWVPKATVQAAICGYPLSMVDRITASGGWADLETQHKYEKWGRDILNTGVIAIVMTAPIGLVFIQMYGPKWLHRSDANGDMQLTQGRKPSGFTDLHEFSDVAFLEEVPLVKRLLEVQVPALVDNADPDSPSGSECDGPTKRQHSLQKIASFLKERIFPVGSNIINEGEIPDEDCSFYIIHSGQVKCTKNGAEVCPRLGPGDFFGELALMSNEKRAATVTVTEETKVLILGRSDFKRLLDPLSEYMIEAYASNRQ